MLILVNNIANPKIMDTDLKIMQIYVGLGFSNLPSIFLSTDI